MEWVETTGRTVDEAKEAALDELGVDEHDAEFEVVAEPRHGLFGRLRTEARVRARVQPTTPRAKDDRRRRRHRGEGGQERATSSGGGNRSPRESSAGSGRPAGGSPVAVAGNPEATRGRQAAASQPADADPVPVDTGAPVDKAAPSDTAAPTDAAVTDDPAVAGGPALKQTARAGDASATDDAEPESADDRPRARRNRNRRRGGGTPAAATTAEAAEQGPDEEGHVEVPLEEQGKVAEAFLQGLVAEMGVVATTAIHQDEESVEVTLNGDDLGLLIGPKGATLQALQELTRTVVQRKTGASNGRLLIDVSGYRQKRAAALARFAQQIASEVLASGQRKALEPMSPADRKVVHDTVNEIDGVATLSEGEDTNRRVVIYAVTD